MATTGDTKKLTVLKTLTTLIEGVTEGGGYDFTLTGRVFRGRALFGADEVTPYVSIVENPREDPQASQAGQNRGVRLEWWALQIQGWVTPVDPANPTDTLYGLMGAVESRIALVLSPGANYRLGGLIADARIGPGAVLAATPDFGWADCFYLPVHLQVATIIGDPWNTTSKP